MTDAATLQAVASAGAFIERRISRGQREAGELEASDALMGRIAALLTPEPERAAPEKASKAAAKK